MMKIRAEMGKDTVMLQGIIEADETYIGGKNSTPPPGCRSARRIGVAHLVSNTTGETLRDFIRGVVNTDNSELIRPVSWLQRDR